MNYRVTYAFSVAAIVGGIRNQFAVYSLAHAVAPERHFHRIAQVQALPVSEPSVQVAKAESGAPLISMNCDNAPIRLAFEDLFKAAGENCSLSKDISGNVTLSVHSLSFKAVLNVLFRSSRSYLTCDVNDNVYYIESLSSLPVGDMGWAGPTSPWPIWRSEPDNLYKIPIKNMSAASMVDRLNAVDIRGAGILPLHARVILLTPDNSLLVEGTPENFQAVKEIVKNLDMPILQAQIRVTFVDVTDADLSNLGVSSQLICGDPGSTVNLTLVQSLRQGKLPVGQSISLAAGNGEKCDEFVSGLSDIEPPKIEIEAAPTIVSNDYPTQVNTINVHLVSPHDFDFTAKVYSGETILLAARPEPASKYQLIFLAATIMPDAADREPAQPNTPDNATGDNQANPK